MKKTKNKSNVSLLGTEISPQEEIYVPPLDTLTVKIQSLRLMDEGPKRFNVRVTFYDQLILAGIISSIGARFVAKDKTLLKGTMCYDPSDYERMCLLADHPLCVTIQPLPSVEPSLSTLASELKTDNSKTSNSKTESFIRNFEDISACNIDILELFIDKSKVRIRKRMELLAQPSTLRTKSWDNLPEISIVLIITRNPLNKYHHEVIRKANYMKITLVASYNMLIPYNDEYVYTAASKMPVENDANAGVVMFNQGCRVPKRFQAVNFYPKWESLRNSEENFTRDDKKFECVIEDLQNVAKINVEEYMKNISHTTIWGSFHRTLILKKSEGWLSEHLRRHCWPFELHIYGEKGGYSFMSSLNLFKLLYPGENTIRMVMPLEWINSDVMQEKCGCDLLITPNDKASSVVTTQKVNKAESGGIHSGGGSGDATICVRPTGADESPAFVIVEVKLARPLVQIVIPPHISNSEINGLLHDIEQAGPNKRECTGRGQLDRDWQATVKIAANSLRKVPYYGTTDFCNLNRQLSESRTRVELSTSFWQDAAVYVNNNFVVQNFLQSDETYEELLMMSHACLMKSVCSTLVGVESGHGVDLDPTLKAARHARQMQDIPHALDLYLQVVVEQPRSADCWRELSTCLKDVDIDLANVCLNKAVVLNPRHPLSLLSKGCMLMEEDPVSAEPFFVALLALYPFWLTGWVIASAYYIERELYHMADQILFYSQLTQKEGLSSDPKYPRSWEHELGEWWDYTPLLPGMSPYYDAADLLLRLRCITLSEVCVSRALSVAGETAVYHYQVALCCRLRGRFQDALCHLRTALDRYGELTYLRTLEAECYHKLKNIEAANGAFEKAGCCIGAYGILLSGPSRDAQSARTVLVELLQRQPSAYAWMALAHDWLKRAASVEAVVEAAGDQLSTEACAAACCVQALALDRRTADAWALLATLVKPSARRMHCIQMAKASGYEFTSHGKMESKKSSKQSLCHRLGTALRECRCKLCENMHF